MESPDLVSVLSGMGLLAPGESAAVRPLTGGVSSDIAVVTTSGGRRFCVKRALPQLRVATVWQAPVARNAAEAQWIRTVARWQPGAVPTLLAEDAAHGLFAMAFLPPETHPVWKAELLAGTADAGFAAVVGQALGAIHSRSAAEPELEQAFDNEATFEPIRIEPYLRATARAHPDLSDWFEALAQRTLATRRALVHGDVSPKNILHGPQGPVFLDAECACWGDPAFDLAFCLNHLLLKGAHRPGRRDAYLACFSALADGYLRQVTWEPASEVERRCADLLPALLLARVDGRSPVEYLDEGQQGRVRAAARALLRAGPATTLAAILRRLGRNDG